MHVEPKELSHTAGRNAKLITNFGRQAVSYITNILEDRTITFLGNYSNELKTYVHTKVCTQMNIAALLITAKTQKHSRWPSLGEWIYSRKSK